jgi:zinc transport system ATP-binding protein
MAQILCKELAVGYEGRSVADGLNFEINSGDFLCIIGENGSGKSTLMKTLLGLLPPVGGEMIIGDGLGAGEIGYLPQQTVVQKDFPASVEEIVLSGCQGRCGLRPFYNKNERAIATASMERMSVLELRRRCYRELSGGQQQRVLLARALSATRKLILLDEPVSGLDPKVTAEMYALIEQINKSGITVIMISHDISAAMRYATHVLYVGKNTFFGTREEYAESGVAAGHFAIKGGAR